MEDRLDPDKEAATAKEVEQFYEVNDINNEVRLQCKFCNTSAKNIGGIKTHITRMHAGISTPNGKSNGGVKRKPDLESDADDDTEKKKPKVSPVFDIIGEGILDGIDETLLEEMENIPQSTQAVNVTSIMEDFIKSEAGVLSNHTSSR